MSVGQQSRAESFVSLHLDAKRRRAQTQCGPLKTDNCLMRRHARLQEDRQANNALARDGRKLDRAAFRRESHEGDETRRRKVHVADGVAGIPQT